MAYNKIGFHIGVPANATGYGDYIRALDAFGITAVCMSVGGGGLGDIVAMWDSGSQVDHVAVVRYKPPAGHPDGNEDVPRYDMAPAAAAARFWEWTRALIGNEVKKYNDRIWLKVGNELDRNESEWLAQFYAEIWQLMQSDPDGPYKLVAFNWSAGEPLPEHWRGPHMLDFLRLAEQHPDSIGIGLHEYSYANSLQADYPYQIGRFQTLFDICDAHGIARPPIFIHEFGWRQDTMPGVATAMEQLPFAAALYAEYPQIRGAGLWTLQTAGGYGNPHISQKAQPMIVPITEYTLTTQFDDPAPPPKRHTAIVVKLPQDCTQEEWIQAAAAAYQFRHSQTASHDDTRTMLLAGNADSFVKFTHPERDADAIAMVEALNYRWEPLYIDPDPIPEPQPPPFTIIVDELPQHPTKSYATRGLEAITHVTIHHTVSPPDRSIESIAAYHVNSNGWPGIGYHFVIKADGRIYLTNYLTTKSYHAGSSAPGDENLISVGIALQGDFTSNTPPQPQQDAARALVAYLRELLPNPLTVVGHRHMPGAATQCPGNTHAQWLPYVTGDSANPAPAPEPPPPPPAGKSINFTEYLLPANGSIGPWQVFEKSGGGTVDQQSQVHGGIVYRVKSGPAGTTEYEELRIANGMIQRRYDTSPGNGRAYKLDDGAGWSNWMPVVMRESEVYRRAPRVTWYELGNGCAPAGDDGYVVSYLRFAKFHETWLSPAGDSLANVAELHWCQSPDGPWIERYFVAPGRWYVMWENNVGASHYAADEPPGRPPLPLQIVPCLQ